MFRLLSRSGATPRVRSLSLAIIVLAYVAIAGCDSQGPALLIELQGTVTQQFNGDPIEGVLAELQPILLVTLLEPDKSLFTAYHRG